MADETLVGKTILQLDPLTGQIDRVNSYIEVHVTGRPASQKLPLDAVGLRGLSAKEVVQLTHPEIVTDAQFITFITGPAGLKGNDGTNGKTAYELAVQQGFVGTIDAWLASLIGAKGNIGEQGEKGDTGDVGKSAYQHALDTGFVGTLPEWLASLIGDDGVAGKSAYELALDHGFVGTEEEWIASLIGSDGAKGSSAYEIAKADGFVGTEAEWLLSLKGSEGGSGVDGNSAYTIAKLNGFVGTEAEWLASLKGGKGDTGEQGETGADGVAGKSAYEVAVQEGYTDSRPAWLASLKGQKGDTGAIATIGVYAGTVEDEEALPDAADYEVGDYFFVGTHIFMKANGAWEDVGNFQGVPGKDGSGITILGELSNIGFLPAVAERNGDAWLIGKSMYVWNGVRWQLQGQEGLQGIQGIQGIQGKSALEVIHDANPAIDTVPKMVEYLRGPQGIQGTEGDSALSFVTDGHVASAAGLPETAEEGHGYIVGQVEGQYEYYVMLKGSWFNLGRNVGPAGPRGQDGPRGATGQQGETGTSIKAMGYVENFNNLPNPDPLVDGVMYMAGFPSNSPRFGEIHMFIRSTIVSGLPVTGSRYYWQDMGNLRGRDGLIGPRGPSGLPVNAKGELATVGDLPTTGNSLGDGYEIGGYIYVYGDDGFERMGEWRGLPGTNGTLGKSAYEIAVAKGFQGSETQWLTSLKGKDGVSFEYIGHFADVAALPAGVHTNQSATVAGDPVKLFLWNTGGWIDVGNAGQKGDTGNIGLTGPNGKSAYEVAQEQGYGGSQAQWLASLNGLAGASAYEIAKSGGFVGTQEQWVASLNGTDGLDGQSAYQAAREEGFVGTQEQWIASLVGKSLQFIGDFATSADFPAGVISNVATAGGHVFIHDGATWIDVGPIAEGPKGEQGETGAAGEDGADGKSAYELAQAAGFVGTEAQWRASLKGDTGAVGKSIYQDAVDRGLFTGTFPEFLELQKGDPGLSAYDNALENGTIPPETTFEQFLETLKGPQGDTGPIGTTGPAITIIGTLDNASLLPETGTAGTGYAIPDQTTPGTYNCYIWLPAVTQWFNLGHIVGANGEKGEQGVRGLQGLKGNPGEKGEVGSIWIVLGREPQAIDGRIDDYFLNSASQEYFRKTGAAVWASLGFMGGGNLYKPNNDGKTKGIKDGAWVDLTLMDTIPADATETYQLVNGQWKKFDTYTLKAVVATTTVDFNAARVFRIDNTAAATVALTNVPDADHATTVVVKVYGKVGAFQWTLPAGKGTLRWFDGAAPAFTNDVTTIVFTWDGREMTGAVPN